MIAQDGSYEPPVEARQHFEQADALEEENEFAQALHECELAIQLAPDWPEAHNLRGILLEELGQTEEALAAYGEAIRLDPTCQAAQENLLEAEKELNSEEEAESLQPVTSALEPITPSLSGEVPACSVCGRQDATLRIVSYPFVVSIIFVTFQRVFAGLWCSKHRNLRLLFASLITATIGLVGIPFGFVFAPLALLKLARGGDQPADLNFQLLKNLAEFKLRNGYRQEAIGCLESCLRFRDDETIRGRLGELYKTEEGFAEERDRPQVLPVVGAMLGSAMVGIVLGILNYASTMGWALLPEKLPIYVVILTWAVTVALVFIGGLALFRLVEWGLARLRCHQMAFSVSMALISAALAIYGFLVGQAIGEYTQLLLSGLAFESASDTLVTIVAVLTRGGVHTVLGFIGASEMWGKIYLLILSVAAIFYTAMSIATAAGTVQWQRRLATVRVATAEPTALSSGWPAMIAVPLSLALLAGLIPQQGTVDYFDAITHNWRGVELFEQGEVDQAVQELQAAVRLKPGWATARDNLVWAYYNQGKLDEAIIEVEEALRLNPRFDDTYLQLISMYMDRAEFEKAMKLVEALAQAQSDWGAPHALLAEVYYQLDQNDLMERELQKALDAQGKDAYTHYTLACVYSILRQFSEAESHLLKAIELAPEAESLYLSLAQTYSEQKQFDQAWQMTDKALSLHKDYADAYVTRAGIYIDQENLERALEELSQAEKIAPADGPLHSSLSFVYFQKGQVDEALREGKEAVRLAPYYAGGHTNLAFAYYAQGQIDLALVAAQQAIKLNPKYDTPHYILGLCYMSKGDNKEAVVELQKFLGLYWDRAYVRDYKVKAEAYLAKLP
jgi:tetratricopeptide (TPR) repeat protein